MKRFTIIPALMLAGSCLLSGCSGCSKEANVDLSSAHTTAAVETMAPTTAQPSEEETETSTAVSEESAAASVSASTETYTSGNISIQYPVVSSMDDEEKEKKVNELLKSNALSFLKAQGVDEKKDTLSIKCKIVSADRRRITAVYTGQLNASGAAHPISVFFTNTVDLNKGTDIGFSTYADPYTMAGYVMSEDCQFDGLSAENTKAAKEYIAAQSIDYYHKLFESADFPLEDGKFPESFSYEKQGEIYFSIPMPHAMGDYAIVKFTPDTK